VRGERRLAAEFDALHLGVGPAARRAFENPAALELGRDAKHGKDKLGKIRGRIDNRLGNRTQARAGALHVAGDHQKIGRIAREAVNGRSDDNIAGREAFISFLSCGRSAVVPVVFSAEHFFASAGREWGAMTGEVLGVGRDAGIAVNHARIVHHTRIVHHKCASKKRNWINALVLIQIS